MARKNQAVQVADHDEDEDNTPAEEVSMADALAEDAALAASEPATAPTAKTRDRWDPIQNNAFYEAVASRSAVKNGVLVFTGTLQDVLDDLDEHFPVDQPGQIGVNEAKLKSKWNGVVFSLKKKGKAFPAFPGSTPRFKADEVGDIFKRHGIDLPAVGVASGADDSDDDSEEGTGSDDE